MKLTHKNKATAYSKKWTIKNRLLLKSAVIVIISFVILSWFLSYIPRGNLEDLSIATIKQTLSKASFESMNLQQFLGYSIIHQPLISAA
jgi:hypothetical protein